MVHKIMVMGLTSNVSFDLSNTLLVIIGKNVSNLHLAVIGYINEGTFMQLNNTK